ncbi:hypothetical protein GLU01_01350 [Nanohaloarchaea archaeon]|nr:hypothetical protein [Candidatus Nanohaloarchaea archaeon]
MRHPVFDSRSRLPDMRAKAAISGAILVTSIAGASATFLDSYGTISGTTEINKPVTISINGDNNVVLNKKTAFGISASDDMRLLNTTDGSNKGLVKSIEIAKDKDEKELDDVSLSDVDELSLRIDGITVDKEDVQ